MSLHEQLIATPDAPGLARRLLGSYLRAVAWSAPLQEVDLVLAVSEAVTNAAEHAYPTGEPGSGAPVQTAVGSTLRSASRTPVTSRPAWHAADC
jgi:hypothetical protein